MFYSLKKRALELALALVFVCLFFKKTIKFIIKTGTHWANKYIYTYIFCSETLIYYGK